MLRTEEDRRAAKDNRMRKHVGSAKQRAQLQMQSGFSFESTGNTETGPSAIDDLKKQVASLQSQLTTKMAQKKSKGFNDKRATGKTQDGVFVPPNTKPHMSKQPRRNHSNRPRPWYCFNCGEDGHISTFCTNDSNPTLVSEKRRQLEDRQRVWDQQNHPDLPLN